MTIIVQTTASASKRDYEWLKTSVAKWNGNRSDLASLIPDFVMLAEKRINADLESRKQEAVITLSVSGASPSTAMPEDACEIRSLALVGGNELDYLPPAAFNSLSEESGSPAHFTAVGSTLYLAPVPDGPYSLQLTYRQHVPALADSAGTNWLIEQSPDVYLAASMCESIMYTKNMADLPMWEQKYASAIAGLNRDDSLVGAQLHVRSDARTV